MELYSILPVTLASVLASLTNSNAPQEEAVITTHVSPEIAGLWELELDSLPPLNTEATQFNETGNVEPTKNSVNPAIVGNESMVDIQEQRKIRSIKTVAEQHTCRERYNFAADNVVITTSGEEWSYGEYIYQHQSEGLPVIAINTLYDNNKTDCSGNRIDQTGESIIAYVDYEPEKNKMAWCSDPFGNDCFMTFHKLMP